MTTPRGRVYPQAEARRMAFTERPVRAGEVILQAGANNGLLISTVAGRFEVIAVDNEMRVPISEVGPDQILGEVSFFDGQPVSADVVALTDGRIGELLRADFDRWAVADPTLAHLLMMDVATTLSQRLRTLTTRVAALEYALDQGMQDSPFRI